MCIKDSTLIMTILQITLEHHFVHQLIFLPLYRNLLRYIITLDWRLQDLINHGSTYEPNITLYWTYNLNYSLHFVLSRSWSSMTWHIGQSMKTFKFLTRTPYSLNILMLQSYLQFLPWLYYIKFFSSLYSCQYSLYIHIFMAYNIESNTWFSSTTYGKILHKQHNDTISL